MKRLWTNILDYVSDREDPAEPAYEPVHVAAMVLLVLLGISVLFWLFWALLVFGGGIQAKILPFLAVMLRVRTAADFDYVGYPYEMGVFEGWVTNLVALVFLTLLIAAVAYLFNDKRLSIDRRKNT